MDGFFNQSNWQSPQTLALLGAAGGFLDPNGGMGAGFQGAMQGMMGGHQLRAMQDAAELKKAQAQMKQQELLRQIEMRNWWQQNIRPGDTSRDVANKVLSSGYPELLAHMKNLPQYKAKIETVDDQGKPVVKFIDTVGNIENTGETPWKAPIKMDQGGFNALIDPVTMKAVAQYGKTMSPDAGANLAQRKYEFGVTNARENAKFGMDYNPEYLSMKEGIKAAARESAQLQAKAQNALPAAINTVNQVMETTNKLMNHPALESMVGGLPTRMIGEGKAFYGGNKEADFKALYNQIGAQQFLAAIEYMRGLGALTEREGEKAQNSVTNLSTSQSVDDFKNGLKVFQGVMMNGLNKIQSQAGIKANPVLNDYEQQPSRNDRNSYMSPDGIKSTIKNMR